MSRTSRIRILFLVSAALLLELACRTGLIGRFSMIPPSEMVSDLFSLLRAGKLNQGIARSLLNIAIAFFSAVVVGIVVGTVVHRLGRLRKALDPFFASYYAIPIFAFYPMFIVLLGLEGHPQIIIGFLLAVVAVIVNTLNGLDRVPRVFLKTAKTLHMSGARTAWKITLPAAVPYIFTGVKLASAYAFTGVIGSEFILSSSGLGFEISYAYNNFNNSVMYPLILFVLIIAVAVNMTFHYSEQVLLRRRGRQ